MSVQDKIDILMATRMMASEEQVRSFDETVRSLPREPIERANLTKMFLVFDDNTEHHEVMWGLIHCIEYAYSVQPVDTYVEDFVHSLPQMITNAQSYASTFLCRMTNSESCHAALERIVFGTIDSQVRDALQKLLVIVTAPSPRKGRDFALFLLEKIQQPIS